MQDVLSFAEGMNSEKMWLQVHEANHHAIEFYKRYGFLSKPGLTLYQSGKGSYRVLRLDLSLSH